MINQSVAPPQYKHQSYPKMLYKKETEVDKYGILQQLTIIAADPNEHADALKEGWYETPDCKGRRRVGRDKGETINAKVKAREEAKAKKDKFKDKFKE